MNSISETNHNHKRILIIGAGFLQDFVIKKAKSMGYYTLAVDMNPNSPGFRSADKSAAINITDKHACYEFAKEQKIDGVLTAATDYGVITAAHIAQALGLPGLSNEAARRVKNKYAVRKAFMEHEVDDTKNVYNVTPDTKLNEIYNEIEYPVIVKPGDGSGSKGITVVHFPDELRDACETALRYSFAKKALVEPFIKGIEYGAESLVVNGEVVFSVIMKKLMTTPPHYAELGHAIPCGLPKKTEEKALAYVKKAIAALEINHGSVNMDMLITDAGDIHIIDVGARMGGNMIGTFIVPYGTGFDYDGNMLRIAVGDEPDYTVYPHSAVATRLLAFKGGTVKRLPDIERLRRKFGVEIYHHLHIGQTVNEYHTNLDGEGYIIARADTVEKAEADAQNALDELTAEIL